MAANSEANGGQALVDHEVVGRRIRNSNEHFGTGDGDGGIRILLGAFYEDRPSAHISVDRFWAATVSKNARAQVIADAAAISAAEGWGDLKGWACARVGEYKKAPTIDGAVATPTATNSQHADLLKAHWALVAQADSGKDKRRKALTVATVLADHFNTLLKTNSTGAEFIEAP